MLKQSFKLLQKCIKNHHPQQLINKHRELYVHNLKNFHRCFATSNVKRAKIFVDFENQFAYNVLQPPSTFASTNNNVKDDFEGQFLNRNWRSASASEITQAFHKIVNYCVANNINLSDNRFDNLVDGLMDNVEHLTTEELAALLNCLVKLPQTESVRSHNFHDVWSALDDVCCWRLRDWDLQTAFMFADLWYKLNLGRISSFIGEVLNRLSRKPARLTKDELLHAFFLMNVFRRRCIDFQFESALEAKIAEMTVDELAIIAMGYFKTQSKIKIPSVLLCMIDKIKSESASIHDISLSAILKIIRYSKPIHQSEQVLELMECLTSQINRLSNMSCLHIGLLGTTIAVSHEKSLALVAQKLVKDMGDIDVIRLKDIERLLVAVTMFDFHPKTEPDVLETAYKELHRPERQLERTRHPRSIISSLSCLSMRNIYSHELANEVLNVDFINETFGKNSKALPRELFFLDRNIEIDCPDYQGNRLLPATLYKAAKWLTEFTPSYNQFKKISAADKLFLDVMDAAVAAVGGKKFIYIDHILPHFSKSDIVLCRDKVTKKFVEPRGFENYILGDVMIPCNLEEFTWYALVVAGWNLTTRNGTKPLGILAMKQRQLKKIGYEPILIIWSEFQILQREERVDYILNKIT